MWADTLHKFMFYKLHVLFGRWTTRFERSRVGCSQASKLFHDLFPDGYSNFSRIKNQLKINVASVRKKRPIGILVQRMDLEEGAKRISCSVWDDPKKFIPKRELHRNCKFSKRKFFSSSLSFCVSSWFSCMLIYHQSRRALLSALDKLGWNPVSEESWLHEGNVKKKNVDKCLGPLRIIQKLPFRTASHIR